MTTMQTLRSTQTMQVAPMHTNCTPYTEIELAIQAYLAERDSVTTEEELQEARVGLDITAEYAAIPEILASAMEGVQ